MAFCRVRRMRPLAASATLPMTLRAASRDSADGRGIGTFTPFPSTPGLRLMPAPRIASAMLPARDTSKGVTRRSVGDLSVICARPLSACDSPYASTMMWSSMAGLAVEPRILLNSRWAYATCLDIASLIFAGSTPESSSPASSAEAAAAAGAACFRFEEAHLRRSPSAPGNAAGRRSKADGATTTAGRIARNAGRRPQTRLLASDMAAIEHANSVHMSMVSEPATCDKLTT